MIVGVDVGGTKTRVRVEDRGILIADRTLRTSAWLADAPLTDPHAVAALLDAFADVDGVDTAPLAVGAHDLDSDEDVDEFTRLLQARRHGPVLAVNDVELVGHAAGIPDAISVIAGTGSKVVGHDATGGTISAGGYGYLIDDDGSAPALAREAVRAVVAGADRGETPDILAHGLMAAHDAPDVAIMAARFTRSASMTTWAQLAPVVFDAAEAGSMLAQRVVDDAARRLADNVALVRARGAIGTDVVCAGGVLTHRHRLFHALTRHLGALIPALRVQLLTQPPVAGAVALARALETAHHSPSNKARNGGRAR